MSSSGTSVFCRPVLQAKHLTRIFAAVRGRPLELFRDLDLTVDAAEMVAIVGRSGSGKSSLLHLLAGLEKPSSGEVWVGDAALHALGPEPLADLRNRSIGYVWQFHYLLPEFSAQENVAMPLRARGIPAKTAMAKAAEWLDRVQLRERATHRPGELSGGEQQRVALARAMVTGPAILLADEPTGDLDDETAMQLLALLRSLCAEEHLAVVLVTHNGEVAARCDRVLRLVEGRLKRA